jgi:hypothetical protein
MISMLAKGMEVMVGMMGNVMQGFEKQVTRPSCTTQQLNSPQKTV